MIDAFFSAGILMTYLSAVVPRLKAVQDLFRTSNPGGDPPQPLPRTLLPSPHPAGGLQYPDPNRPNTSLRFPQLQSLYRSNNGQPNFASLPPPVQRTLSPQPPRHNSASSSSGIVKSSSWGEDLRSSISSPATSTPIRSGGGAPKPRPNSIASQPQQFQQSHSQARLSLDSKMKEEGNRRKDPTSLMDFDMSGVCLRLISV